MVPLVDVSSTTRLLGEVKLIGAFDPAEDLDSDGIQDLGDNCPFQPNPDAGEPREPSSTPPTTADPLGDACQCAEATDDGAVLDPDDFDEIRDYLWRGGSPTRSIAAEIEARCSVAGTPECNIRDLVFLSRRSIPPPRASTRVATRRCRRRPPRETIAAIPITG